MFNKKQWKIPTYIRYFLSYLLIFTVLLLGLYYIIGEQLTTGYFEQRVEHVKSQIDNLASQLNEDLAFLSQMDSSIRANDVLRKNRYIEGKIDGIEVRSELDRYAVSSKMVSSIVYGFRAAETVYSTNLSVSWRDGVFYIKDLMMDEIAFDPNPYLDASYGQLVFLTEEEKEYLIYVPAIRSDANYFFFYILDSGDIWNQLKSLISDEILGVALVDAQKQIVQGVNACALDDYLDFVTLESGIYSHEDGGSVCVNSGILKGYSVVSVISNDFLMREITAAFTNTYLALVLLSMAGFLLIIIAMRMTYVPLKRLMKKIDPHADLHSVYSERLESIFLDVTYKNQILAEKLENYRAAVQKSLLDALVDSGRLSQTIVNTDIDRFFETDKTKGIFVVCLSCQTELCAKEKFKEELQRVLPVGNVCLMLESDRNKIIYLILYPGDELDKEGVLKEFLYRFYEDWACLSAISRESSTPMDIPELYENAVLASRRWPQVPVADYRVAIQDEGYVYPYEKLERLSESLAAHRFSEAEQLVDELLENDGDYVLAESKLRKFYVHNVVTDVLIRVVNTMSMSNISAGAYYDLYSSSLQDCHNHSFEAKKGEISANIRKMLSIYEQHSREQQVNSAIYRQVMEECYKNPDFSIAVLAERFHVSVSHMSNQFKKETNMNFSDYLWRLRLDKAKELLRTTDMSVDEISMEVGYFSGSGFRRRFRQDTGFSPSEYRKQQEETN